MKSLGTTYKALDVVARSSRCHDGIGSATDEADRKLLVCVFSHGCYSEVPASQVE